MQRNFLREVPPPYLQRYFPFLRQFMWKHSQHSQHSRTMGPVQTGQALPVSAHILILVTHRLQPSPPQFHNLKLGGLLSNFKAHFDRIRNWQWGRRCSFLTGALTLNRNVSKRVGRHGNVTAATPLLVCWTSVAGGFGFELWIDWEPGEPEVSGFRQG